jgi:hypothetical protein
VIRNAVRWQSEVDMGKASVMRPWIIALAALLPAPFPAIAAGPGIVSGAYDDAMLVGYDPATKIVSAYFDMEQPGPPTISCIFYLRGTLAGSKAKVATYFPETPADDLIKGDLALQDTTHFQVRLPTDHGGCGNLEPFAHKDQPASFQLNTAHPWTSIAVVKSAKAYFWDMPASATHRKGYLVKGDGVGVHASQAGWIAVDYVGGDKPISGWLRQSDVYPLH